MSSFSSSQTSAGQASANNGSQSSGRARSNDGSLDSLVDDDDVVILDEEEAKIESAFRTMEDNLTHGRRFVIPQIVIPDDDEDEENEDDTIRSEVAEVIDLTGIDDEPIAQPTLPAGPPSRNPPIDPEALTDLILGNNAIVDGTVVEMHMREDLYRAEFLLVQQVYRTESGVMVRGLPLTRTRNIQGQLPRKRNELVLILMIDADDERPDQEQASIEITADEVLRQRTCAFTNANFPTWRYPIGFYNSVEEIQERGMLACRWKYRRVYANATMRKMGKAPAEFAVEHLNPTEVLKEKYRQDELYRLNVWRGGKIRGGAYNPSNPYDNALVANLDDDSQDDQSWIQIQPGQRYSFGDMFCGAGGASCGAEMGGMAIRMGVDHAVWACKTYSHVNPKVNVFQTDMFDFIAMDRDTNNIRVDVLHLSPPCQYWSPAHTVAGINDEANIAILFSCHELIKKLRPRVFTLEQTFGILLPRYEHYFNALVNGFTQYSYSVRWTCVNLTQWGCPSRRIRLIMIGSCPGEALPPFPAPTHSKEPVPGDGTRPLVTVKEMLLKIPRAAETYDELHNPTVLATTRPMAKEPWDPKIPLSRTITCNGGVGNYHYSGKRGFTLRELATLQGFPVDYAFQGGYLKKQIGNAFPPPAVKTLYQHIRKWLEKQDRVIIPPNEQCLLDMGGEEVVEIDDRYDDIPGSSIDKPWVLED
ncbi:S-adenosyl-L-methionine-dependent methyltransferase [Xylariomycetidae sp. FL2044]|nr:S-adenosyl-L-methionine-dependent methyltransferase [Xylariomycetidae sp. FL2044]